MIRCENSRMAGFTLIEILISLVIVSVGLLAVGSFSISIIDTGQISRERLSAVHLAEQVLEQWQSTDVLPTLDTTYCQAAVNAAWATSTSTSTSPCPATGVNTLSTASCKPPTGVEATFTISAQQKQACGPPKAGGASYQFYNNIPVLKPGSPFANTPLVKVVTVNWSHKGKMRSVYLTHLSQVQ